MCTPEPEIARCRCGAEARCVYGAIGFVVRCSAYSRPLEPCWKGPDMKTAAEAIAAWNDVMRGRVSDDDVPVL